MAKSNVALLTEGQAYIQRAKRARQDQIEEIKFDDAARSEWLTGFSKRKKAKIEEKRSRAKERERLEHLEERRKARQELKERAAQNVKSVRAAMGLAEEEEDEDDEEAGPSTVKELREEVEFEDEDQLATVTITEDFEPKEPVKPRIKLPEIPASSKRAMQKAKREKEEAPKRSRSMETKSERKFGRAMEAKRRTKKASLAMDRDGRRGGKGSRGGKGGKDGKGGKARR